MRLTNTDLRETLERIAQQQVDEHRWVNRVAHDVETRMADLETRLDLLANLLGIQWVPVQETPAHWEKVEP